MSCRKILPLEQMKIIYPPNRSHSLLALSLALAATLDLSFMACAWSGPLIAAPKPTKTTTPRDSAEKPAENKPEPPIENVVNVSTNELVDKPHEFLGKNIKFTAKFFAFSSLALDYKPAMRSSKSYLSFLVLRPEAHVPYSEIKLAMAIPKEKDPESQVLTSLKDGDQVEVTGKVFATSLDEPWVDVLRLKKLGGSDDKKDTKKVSANPADNNTPAEAGSGDDAKKEAPKKSREVEDKQPKLPLSE